MNPLEQCWAWVRRHAPGSMLALYLSVTVLHLMGGELVAATVWLAIGTGAYYFSEKLAAIDRAKSK